MVAATIRKIHAKNQLADFQKQWVKGRTYVYYILGDKKDLELDKLKAVGLIEELTQEQIFGY